MSRSLLLLIQAVVINNEVIVLEITENEIATYLFCAQLTHTKANPLTIIEWNTVVKALDKVSLQPEVLFKISPSKLAVLLVEATPAQRKRVLDKVQARQELGVSTLELKELFHQGYGIMFRSQMPNVLKKLTQKHTPAFFYYTGDTTILSHRLFGVVGAREASKEELRQTTEISIEAAAQGVVIISGGARGVDTTAVDAALENGGKAIVFPADGLANWIKSSAIQNYISNGQLLLMSAQRINAHFTGAYAIQRNKFIHAPAEAVLVASSKISAQKKSGTWEGVLDNLAFAWTPIYVLGKSEGVNKLKAEGNATSFSSMAEIFKQEVTNSTSIDEEIVSLVQLAIAKGLPEAKLIQKITEVSVSYYQEKTEKLVEAEGRVVSEQLSLEDYL